MTIGGLNDFVTEQFSCSRSVLLLQHNIVLRQMQGFQPFAFLDLVRCPCKWLFNVQSTLYFSEYSFHKLLSFFINYLVINKSRCGVRNPNNISLVIHLDHIVLVKEPQVVNMRQVQDGSGQLWKS